MTEHFWPWWISCIRIIRWIMRKISKMQYYLYILYVMWKILACYMCANARAGVCLRAVSSLIEQKKKNFQ